MMIIRVEIAQMVILLIMVLSLSTCVKKSIGQTEDKIYFKGALECQGCEDCVHIPATLEPEDAYAKQLSAYFVSSLQSKDFCDQILTDSILEHIYQRKSFIKVIVGAYLNGMDMPDSFGTTYFEDHKIELLFGVADRKVLHEITDTLLFHGTADGLMAIWDDLDVSKINHSEHYFDNVLMSGNIFKIAELSVSMHLNGYEEREKRLLIAAESISGFEEYYVALEQLLSQPVFDYGEYISKIYFEP